MRRLYLLSPDQRSCRMMVDELRGAGVPEAHLHVVASAGKELQGLPLASAWQTTELGHGIAIGIALGGLAGLLAGLIGQAWPPPGLQVSNLMVFASTFAGAVFGAVVSALMKHHEHNRRLWRFHAELDAGSVLLIVDVPRSEVRMIKSIIGKQYPNTPLETVKPGY